MYLLCVWHYTVLRVHSLTCKNTIIPQTNWHTQHRLLWIFSLSVSVGPSFSLSNLYISNRWLTANARARTLASQAHIHFVIIRKHDSDTIFFFIPFFYIYTFVKYLGLFFFLLQIKYLRIEHDQSNIKTKYIEFTVDISKDLNKFSKRKWRNVENKGEHKAKKNHQPNCKLAQPFAWLCPFYDKKKYEYSPLSYIIHICTFYNQQQ